MPLEYAFDALSSHGAMHAAQIELFLLGMRCGGSVESHNGGSAESLEDRTTTSNRFPKAQAQRMVLPAPVITPI